MVVQYFKGGSIRNEIGGTKKEASTLWCQGRFEEKEEEEEEEEENN